MGSGEIGQLATGRTYASMWSCATDASETRFGACAAHQNQLQIWSAETVAQWQSWLGTTLCLANGVWAFYSVCTASRIAACQVHAWPMLPEMDCLGLLHVMPST